MFYEDADGEVFTWPDERRVDYPRGLIIHIDTHEFETVGVALEETMPGSYSARRWVLVSPVTSNGFKLQPRLVAEAGVKGLKQRAERALLEERR